VTGPFKWFGPGLNSRPNSSILQLKTRTQDRTLGGINLTEQAFLSTNPFEHKIKAQFDTIDLQSSML